MANAALALILLALYGLLAFGVRIAVQLRRTGSSGFNGLHRAAGFLERVGGVLLLAAALLCLAGPVLQLAGALEPLRALSGAGWSIAGGALASLGIAITVVSQFAMGDAWRIGVDPGERTDLVTDGPFAIVRNPIYAAMIPAFIGVALLAANPVTIAGAILLMVALELHTRLIEEPYLTRVHGHRYTAYASRVGRFVPAVGRLRLDGSRRSR